MKRDDFFLCQFSEASTVGLDIQASSFIEVEFHNRTKLKIDAEDG